MFGFHPPLQRAVRGWVFLFVCVLTAPAPSQSFTPYLVKDTNPGNGTGVRGGGSEPGAFTALGGMLMFSSFDGSDPQGVLSKSDGTEAGTVQVREDGPNGTLKHHEVSNGKLFFLAEGISGDGLGEELWVSDGTEAGTLLVKDIYPGSSSALPQNLTDVNGTLFFQARDGVHGTELWKTDGTELGTVRVKDINPGSDNSSPGALTNFNGVLFFRANDGGPLGSQLWKSDGTEAATEPVKDISPTGIGQIIDVSTLILPASDSSFGTELWRTDGTEAGTVLVKDINPGASGSLPFQPHENYLTKQNESTVFFVADDGINGEELWKTDGTEAGTVRIKDINDGGSNSAPARLTNLNGTIFFQANDGTHGTELWKSDGTEAGTQMVLDLVPGSGSPGFNSSELVAVHDLLFFTAVVPGNVRNNSVLYVTDGTADGAEPVFTIPEHSGSTVRITDLEFTGTHLFFRAPLDVSETGSVSNFELFAIAIPSLPGDYNGDGRVDAGDYVAWRNHLGTDYHLYGNGYELGDSTALVDEADYAWWKEHYGQSAETPGSGDMAPSVPEPATLLLAVAGSLYAAARRSPRH